MDVITALEGMASRFANTPMIDEPDENTIHRWKTLFNLSDPCSTIMEYRSALDVPCVSDEHWDIVRTEKEAEGFDRESYEFSLTLRQRRSERTETPHTKTEQGKRTNGTYLLQLMPSCSQISTPGAIQAYANLDTLPAQVADNEKPDVSFVQISGTAKLTIERFLLQDNPHIRTLFVRVSAPARKELNTSSVYPTLGIESTLPQFRLGNNENDQSPIVEQDQYPVWYFFYGTLNCPITLKQVLGSQIDEVIYEPSHVKNARLVTWGGKYRGLVDNEGGEVEGSAFLVETKELEQNLCHYETDRYEVVRCEIHMNEETTRHGLTFRFIEDG